METTRSQTQAFTQQVQSQLRLDETTHKKGKKNETKTRKKTNSIFVFFFSSIENSLTTRNINGKWSVGLVQMLKLTYLQQKVKRNMYIRYGGGERKPGWLYH